MSRVKCTVRVKIKSNLNFPCGDITEASILQARNKATWCFKGVDRQSRSMMPLLCWHFDDGWVWRGYVWPYGKQND